MPHLSKVFIIVGKSLHTERYADILKVFSDALLFGITQHFLGGRISMDYIPFAFFEKHDPVACGLKNTPVARFRLC